MLEWNVYHHNFNKDEIEVYNVFDHWRFQEDLRSLVNECKTKEEFGERLNRDLMYYYWSKSEWEVLVYPWCGSRNDKPIKIDVYDQVRNNWNVFLDYVWENRDVIKDMQ